MSACLIEREPIATESPALGDHDELLEFAELCKKRLGYTGAHTAAAKKRLGYAVRAALARHNMAPLKAEAVDAYKQKKLADLKGKFGGLLGIWSVGTWTFSKLSDWTQPVPRHALQTALDVQDDLRKVGELEWRICHLSTDPFLVAKITDQQTGITDYFHLEVWQEDSFELDRDITGRTA